ncbi:hypothetical protein ACKKBG_A33545 [Auxenochlorella protothecoides x Auxenochlorella symbiontica]
MASSTTSIIGNFLVPLRCPRCIQRQHDRILQQDRIHGDRRSQWKGERCREHSSTCYGKLYGNHDWAPGHSHFSLDRRGHQCVAWGDRGRCRGILDPDICKRGGVGSHQFYGTWLRQL